MRIKSIVTENDFIAYAPIGLSKVDGSIQLVNNSYAWNDTYKAIHVNDASNAQIGYFRLPLGFLKVGDKVKISYEIMVISGDKPQLILDYNLTNISGSGSGSNIFSPSQKTSEFENIEITFTITKDAYYSIPFGLTTAQTGEFYMRKCVVKFDAIYVDNPKKFKRGFRWYNIQKATGSSFVVSPDHGYDTATLAIDSTNKVINLTHGKPFGITKAALPFVQEDGAATTNNYYVKTKSASTVGCTIMIYDKATNTLQDPATVPTNIWFALFFVGYDNEIEPI